MIERVDPKQRPDRRCRHFPSEEFLAQVDLLGEVDSDYRMPHCFESAQLTIGVCVRLRPESQVNKKPIIAVALGLTQRFARHWGETLFFLAGALRDQLLSPVGESCDAL